MLRLRTIPTMLLTPGVLVAALVASPAMAQDATQQKTVVEQVQDKAGPADIYDVNADAKADIAKAVARAKKENKRVLLQFGGNWCGWCHKLHDVFKTDAKIARTLLYEYEVVMVDIGHSDKNQDLVTKYEAKIKEAGVPYLTVLNGDGEVVTNQNTSDLEEGDHHDVTKVNDFLTANAATPVSAETVLAEGLAAAKASGKTAFIHLGAPWCGWCHRLEDFMAAHQELFDKYFVDIKIDVDRMEGGRDVAARLRGSESGGIPWIVFQDGAGKALINSDGPEGNIGYPVQEAEIAHFVRMLETVGVPESDRDEFARLLKEAGAKLGH